MKKIVLTSMAVVLGAVLAHAQGTISVQEGAGTVVTNGAALGQGSGVTHQGANSFFYEVLDMTQSQWAGLSAGQQASASALFQLGGNGAGLGLWTDSTVSGVNTGNLTAGGISGSGSTTGTTAANWAAPTANTGYNTAPSYDYYTVLGWSATEGTSWGAISNSIASGNWAVSGATGGYFGQSSVMFNYAGGGASGLLAPNVLSSPAATTGLAGSGYNGSNPALTLGIVTTPEPTTLALAGLGGLSMLFLRRRKA